MILRIGRWRAASRSRVFLIGDRFVAKVQREPFATRERLGYESVAKTWPVPKRFACLRAAGITISIFAFCRGLEGMPMLSDLIRLGSENQVREVADQVAAVYHRAIASATLRPTSAINDRLFRARAMLGGRDTAWYSQEVDGRRRAILDRLRLWAESQSRTLAAVSHGDPTEANVSSLGVFVDFENSGWNDVHGDLSVLLASICSHGSYWVPRYHQQAYEFTRWNRFDRQKEIQNRRAFAKIWLEFLRLLGLSLDYYIEYLLCRVLFTLDPSVMSPEDNDEMWREAVFLEDHGVPDYVDYCLNRAIIRK